MDQPKTKDLFLNTYDAYADAIFRFCSLKVSDRERAQDLTQETFMRYWQTLREGKSIQNHRAYLYTVARNLITDWYRRKKESSLDALTEAGLEFAGQDDGAVLQHAEAEQIMSVLQQLDEDVREVIMLRFVEGMSPKEIAEALEVSPNVISVRVHRGLKKVQELIHAHD